eukprot:jgi/Pico_ML_1/56078/g1671.t1
MGGGLAGAGAMAINVGALMWMRTTVNFQYRYGMSTTQALKHLYAEGGIPRFYRGVFPALLQGPLSRFGDTAANAGHYPWFFTYNFLNEMLPKYDRQTELPQYLLRSAVMGFSSSAVSDTCSNSIRVLKTTKQTAVTSITYPQAFQSVVAKDGIQGLLFRGLGTKIISNGVQGLLFSVLWRLGQDYLEKK